MFVWYNGNSLPTPFAFPYIKSEPLPIMMASVVPLGQPSFLLTPFARGVFILTCATETDYSCSQTTEPGNDDNDHSVKVVSFIDPSARATK